MKDPLIEARQVLAFPQTAFFATTHRTQQNNPQKCTETEIPQENAN
jgi:hypothetical protein